MRTDRELLHDALKILQHKTVGTDWRNQVIEEIYNAVERAETSLADFDEWWEATGKRCWPYEHEALKYTWGVAQQAERERIKEIVRDEYSNKRIDFARIMERIDAAT